MSYAIQVDRLEKSYGSHTVLKGLGFDVIKGEIFALLGVNGAGKPQPLNALKAYGRWTAAVSR